MAVNGRRAQEGYSLPLPQTSREEGAAREWVDHTPHPKTSREEPTTSASRNKFTPRLRASGQTKLNEADTVHLEIEVNIESLEMPKAKLLASQEVYPKLYVTTLSTLTELVLRDTGGVLTAVRRGLAHDYGGLHTEAEGGGRMGGLVVRTQVPRGKLVSLQCEQSSGQLARDLQVWLVTRQMLSKLGVQQLTLATDVRNM